MRLLYSGTQTVDKSRPRSKSLSNAKSLPADLCNPAIASRRQNAAMQERRKAIEVRPASYSRTRLGLPRNRQSSNLPRPGHRASNLGDVAPATKPGFQSASNALSMYAVRNSCECGEHDQCLAPAWAGKRYCGYHWPRDSKLACHAIQATARRTFSRGCNRTTCQAFTGCLLHQFPIN